MEPIALVLHLLGGAAWLGDSVFANVVLVPYVFGQPVERQRDLIRRALLAPERLMIVAALTTAAISRARVAGRLRLGFQLELTGLTVALALMALLRYA